MVHKRMTITGLSFNNDIATNGCK